MVRRERGDRTGGLQRPGTRGGVLTEERGEGDPQLGASEGNGSTEARTIEPPCPKSSLTGVEVTPLSGWSIATSAVPRPRLGVLLPGDTGRGRGAAFAHVQGPRQVFLQWGRGGGHTF